MLAFMFQANASLSFLGRPRPAGHGERCSVNLDPVTPCLDTAHALPKLDDGQPDTGACQVDGDHHNGDAPDSRAGLLPVE